MPIDLSGFDPPIEAAKESYPFVSPVTGEMGGGFNDSRSHGRHGAGDLKAPAGTPIVAPGNMEFVDGRQGGTNLRNNDWWSHWRDVDSGVEYRFAHHGDISGFKPGQVVKQGEQWNVVGSAIDDPHLHMAVHDPVAGKNIDWISPMGLKRGNKFDQGQPFLAGDFEKRADKVAATVGKFNVDDFDPPKKFNVDEFDPPEGFKPQGLSLSSRVGTGIKNLIEQPGSAEEALMQGAEASPVPVETAPVEPRLTRPNLTQAKPTAPPIFAPDISQQIKERGTRLTQSAQALKEMKEGGLNSQEDVDFFNEAVKSHNAELRKLQGQNRKYQRLFGEYQKDPETFFTNNPQYAPEGWTLEKAQEERAQQFDAARKRGGTGPLGKHLAGDNRLPEDRTGVWGVIDKATSIIGEGLALGAPAAAENVGAVHGFTPGLTREEQAQVERNVGQQLTGASRGYLSGRSFGLYQPPKLSLEEQAQGVEGIQQIAGLVGSGQNIAKIGSMTGLQFGPKVQGAGIIRSAFQGVPGAMGTGLIFSIFQKFGTAAGKGLAGQEYKAEPGMAGAGAAKLAEYVGHPEIAKQIVDWSTKYDPIETALLFGATHFGMNAALQGIRGLGDAVGTRRANYQAVKQEKVLRG